MINILLMFNEYFRFNEEEIAQLHNIAPKASIKTVEYDKASTEMLKKAEIISGWIEVEQVKKTEDLSWLHLPTAGVEKFLDKSIYPKADTLLTNSSGVYGLPIAEHILSMIFAFNRNLSKYLADMDKKEWEPVKTRRDFYDSTVGILGLGDIGSEVAKRVDALGAEVLALKRIPDNKPDYVTSLYGPDGINELIQQSDYIILTLPHTDETEGIISRERLQMMKENTFLVNIGRGILIDQQALIEALEKNWIAGAGLDVTTPEPLPEDNQLWELENVILTPHIAHSSPTNSKRWLAIFKENLRRYIGGEPLKNLVDFEAGY